MPCCKIELPWPLIPSGASSVRLEIGGLEIRAVRKLMGRYLSRSSGPQVAGSRVEWFLSESDVQLDAGVCYGETAMDCATREILAAIEACRVLRGGI